MNDENLSQAVLDILQKFNFSALLLLLIGGWIIWFLNNLIVRSSDSLMQKLPTRRFLILQISTLLGFGIYIFGSVALVVGVFNPPKEFLIAAAGSIAVAMGFALKDIAASLVGGLLLLFDRPFQVGDRVTYGNIYGEVLSIGLRTVRILTPAHSVVTIPNSRFITDAVISMNAGTAQMNVTIEFHLAVSADLNKAKALLEEVVVTSRYAYLKEPRSYSFKEATLNDGRLAILLRCRAYVLDTRYEPAFESDITLRASQLFLEHQIARP